MVEKWEIVIPELTGTKRRRVYAYLPESYKYYHDQHYPVLYMFDGHNVFFDSDATYGKSWGMKDYMDISNTQMIIVAVECNHSPDHGRLKEYSPFDFDDPKYGSFKGLGNVTMDWLVHTFKPMIDRKYRTLPDREHTFIAGSSMGGLMSIYALLAYNQYFSRAAALSPSIWVSVSKLTELVRSREWKDTVIYLDYGEKELENHKGMRNDFARFTNNMMQHGLLVTSRLVPGGTHCEACWERQIPYFMETLLYNK